MTFRDNLKNLSSEQLLSLNKTEVETSRDDSTDSRNIIDYTQAEYPELFSFAVEIAKYLPEDVPDEHAWFVTLGATMMAGFIGRAADIAAMPPVSE